MFPLFETLYAQTEGDDQIIDYESRINLMNHIKELDTISHEYIAAIIRYYALEYEKYPFDTLPYKVKVNKNGYKWEMSNLPKRVILMIKKFVEIHLKSLSEDHQRSTMFFNSSKKKKNLENIEATE